jgi:hypothetical protein
MMASRQSEAVRLHRPGAGGGAAGTVGMAAAARTAGPVTKAPSAQDDKPDALLLDEMFSPAIAADLESRGVATRVVAADPVLRALSDLEILEAALLENRVVVTNNVADFESLRRAWETVGREVPGLIYTSDPSFPRARAYFTRLVAALEVVATSHETRRRGGVWWLRPLDLLVLAATLRAGAGPPAAG